MATCDWCNKDTDQLFNCSELGNKFKICKDCYVSYKNGKGVCRVCGSPLNGKSIHGRCLICAQLNITEENRERDEESCGAVLPPEYSNGSTMTEEDFNDWVTFGQGNFTPKLRRELRINWLTKKLANDPDWNPKMIVGYISDFEKLLDKYYDDICSNKYKLKHVAFFKGDKSKIVARENQILLVKE
jgi:hypothetical protein